VGALYYRIGVVETPVNPFANILKNILNGPSQTQNFSIADVDFD
jgi:hypothetical protein